MRETRTSGSVGAPGRQRPGATRRRARRDGDQRRHYEMAAGSAGEVTTALRIALAKGYITATEAAEVDAVLDRVRAMLYRLTH